jgi:UDP-N-acetyl-D-glucosamine dehydrogenase
VSDWSQETSVVAFAEKHPEHGTAPSSVDIEKLLSDIDARRCQVGVIGLGYVGLPLALACCSAGFRVVGFDVDEKKVQTIADGVSPIRHVGNGQMSAAVRAGKLSTTADFSRLAEPDVLILCVPTPLGKHYEPDLSFIEKTGQSVARALRKGQLVVLESATYPGTTGEVLKPILESNGLRSGKDFFLAYSPEREDPGNPDYRTTRIPKVVAGDDEIARELACRFYGHVIVRTVPVSSLETAEAVKLTENIFRSVNIALVNELKLIFAKMGIDIFEVIDAAKTKPFGFMPFYPGPGLGGHCIPIDPFYLTWKAREFDQPTRFIELAGEINSSMPHYVIGRVREALDVHAGKGLKDARVLILGLAYKRDVDDMRESPSLKLMKMLADACAQVDYFDPYFPSIPPSREYAVFTGKRGVDLNGDTVRSYDAVVLVTDHSDLDYAMIARDARIVIDTRNKFKAANGCNAIIVKS